ncbi:hypothetical protein F3J23_14235 [Chryseobacterium sp. Tr-659]|uniref:hypothetical protein n=1 Tax=Chryseobacterium sp. Tr-659 TaxID=2608340 RepID=UPI0014227482|nr:hypothetical protein [Chryseobacterium sp. Tr-659]NIF06604.1 hypothetical protein [Chryseobacterium sp. Tr-659]
MVRILYWNIEKFGINKINEPKAKRKWDDTLTIPPPQAGYRREVIRTTLIQNTPDIFVVVETSTGTGTPGTLVTTGGETGSLFLLKQLRTWFPAPNDWRLVPPLRLGQGNVQEGISVFYNHARVQFTGPWGWQGDANPSDSVATIGAGNLVNYGINWKNALPLGTAPAGNNPINPGIPYRRLAGQWQFRGPVVGGVAPVLGFPNVYNRTPFLTTFWDPASTRTIKLLAFHASPKKQQSADGTNQLSYIQEMTTSLVANEVGVIVGDFNVDIFNTNFEPIAYGRLVTNPPLGVGYTRQINPTPNVWPDKAYVCTMIRSYDNAKPWQTNGYPGYEYVIPKTFSSVDNILTRYGGGTAVGPSTNITIVNRITGTPYNLDAPPIAGAPPGSLVYDSAMALNVGMPAAGLPSALPLPPAGPTGHGGFDRGDIGALTTFVGWDNYRRVRSTSDHMGLIVDV